MRSNVTEHRCHAAVSVRTAVQANAFKSCNAVAIRVTHCGNTMKLGALAVILYHRLISRTNASNGSEDAQNLLAFALHVLVDCSTSEQHDRSNTEDHKHCTRGFKQDLERYIDLQ